MKCQRSFLTSQLTFLHVEYWQEVLWWCLSLLMSIATIVYVLIYQRAWFVPDLAPEEEELMAPMSPRSVGSV
jgi:uncharacterized membrane protein